MKDIELTPEEKNTIKEMAENAFERLNNEIVSPMLGENIKSFRDGYLEMYEHLQGIVLFTEKERDSYKRQIK